MRKKPTIFRPATITLALLLVTPLVRSQQRPTARLLLDQMAEKYSHLVSYQDEGVVITTYDEETGGRIEKLPFKTLFKRPNLFRFEWTDYFLSKLGTKRVIWSNGKDAFTYWEPDRYEKEEELGLAIAGATGVSGGSAHTVPRLLLADEVGGFSVTELKHTSLLGEDVFEGVLCYHIKGAHPNGDFYELWIGKKDLLLRKVRQQKKDTDKVVTDEEVRRNIHVNEPIANTLFDFKPPIKLTPTDDSKSLENLKSILEAAPVWTEFKSEAGRFSILMPAKPNYATQTLETREGRFEHHIFIATVGAALFCFVDYADMPKQLGDAKNSDALFDVARDEILKAAEAKLERETNISMDGHPGRELKLHMYGAEASVRFYLISGRLYQLSITVLDKKGTSEAETIEKFFKSFKALTPPKSIALLAGR
jgi:outer membrane lipoprotein-sorting protein